MTCERIAAADIRAVAIGASAGGVEALSELLPALPADSRTAVFVVLHLPRDRPSLLVGSVRSQVRSSRCVKPATKSR